MSLTRPPKDGAEGPAYVPPANGMWSKYPTLLEFLTLGKWPDGASRERGSMLLCWEDGWFKCWLNDKDGGRSAWLSGESPDALLRHVEAQLSEDRVQWRRSGFGGQKKK